MLVCGRMYAASVRPKKIYSKQRYWASKSCFLCSLIMQKVFLHLLVLSHLCDGVTWLLTGFHLFIFHFAKKPCHDFNNKPSTSPHLCRHIQFNPFGPTTSSGGWQYRRSNHFEMLTQRRQPVTWRRQRPRPSCYSASYPSPPPRLIRYTMHFSTRRKALHRAGPGHCIIKYIELAPCRHPPRDQG